MEGVGIERQGDINRKIMIYYVSQRVRGWVRRWLILRKSICLIPSLLKQGRICMGTRKVLSLQPRLMKETWQMTLSQKVSSPSHWVSGHLDALHKNGWYCIYPTLHFWMEQEMATHSSVLAWRIPGTGEPGGLPSLGSHRVGHDWRDLAAAAIFGYGKETWLATFDWTHLIVGTYRYNLIIVNLAWIQTHSKCDPWFQCPHDH